jgi:hypothetical protein
MARHSIETADTLVPRAPASGLGFFAALKLVRSALRDGIVAQRRYEAQRALGVPHAAAAAKAFDRV